MNAAEHFAWARGRALEYIDLGDAPAALASLELDLGKHEGTAGILHPDLRNLLYEDFLLTGSLANVRQHIETLAGPVGAADV